MSTCLVNSSSFKKKALFSLDILRTASHQDITFTVIAKQTHIPRDICGIHFIDGVSMPEYCVQLSRKVILVMLSSATLYQGLTSLKTSSRRN
jgi:hypothetical protein